MSINDVIDQIAIAAEQKAQDDFLWLMSKFSGLLTSEETRPEDLSPERIQELDQHIRGLGHLPPPRLTLDEINDILTDYPYQLPVEFYDLYQRGNGVLPLGVGDKDWDCYDNYFSFIDLDIYWMPVDKAMEEYRGFLQHSRISNTPSKIFPLMAFERETWAIAGEETQQLTSPVFRFNLNDRNWENPDCIVWTSLAEMFVDDLSDWANWYRNERRRCGN